MLILAIILIIVSILILIYAFYSLKHTHKINKEIDIENQKLQEEYQKINKNIQIAKDEFIKENQNYRDIKQEVNIAQRELIDTRNSLNDIQNNILKTVDNQKELSQRAFKNYCETLEKQYEEQEKEYNKTTDTLNVSYQNLQLKYIQEIDEIKSELDKIRATRAATIQANIKEKEIKEKSSFYCLTIKPTDLDDIKTLERIKFQLHNPRILSMLIWQTYYQKPMNTLCANVLGTDIISGIYKITNQVNDMCYIGQSIDIANRFKQHAKCGLGIDTPVGNKLYKAMQEDGIYNFSFELLEQCNASELNEKEKYYIDLYQSNLYGYNSISAPKK